MNLRELAEHLASEGCDPSSYAIGSRGSASDAYCLTQNGSRWEIYYTERGLDQAPLHTSESESEACELFRKLILSFRHDHCVGFFRSEESATKLCQRLREIGVAPRQDHIRYGGPNDPRFRVFVTGKAIFEAKAALGQVPLDDEG